MSNPNYIPRSHPVRVILDNAAHGRQPSPHDMDELLTAVSDERLPAGHSLDRYRAELAREAKTIAAIHATGAHGNAATAAENAAARIAATMTPEQRALSTTETRNSRRDMDDMIDRVFSN